MRIGVGDFEASLWPTASFVLIVCLVFLWCRKHSRFYLFCFLIFGIYLLFALDKVFFPIRVNSDYIEVISPAQFMRSINLIPFNFNLNELANIVILQIFQNILLTVPFGFGVNFIVPVKAKHMLWLALAVGVGSETGQLIIGLLLRYPYRIIDVNDAMLNALGVLIGYGIFKAVVWLYVLVSERPAIMDK